MSLLNRLFKTKVKDTSEKRRLVVANNERPLREVFNREHYEIVKEALEQEFQNTPQIRRVEK